MEINGRNFSFTSDVPLTYDITLDIYAITVLT